MSIKSWNPVTTISQQEACILKRCQKNRRLFAFLRENRGRLFNDDFQNELTEMYRDTGAGKDAAPPAMMAMALILQGYLGISDADAVEMTVVDLRWQMVLDRIGEEKTAFSQGALFQFRERLIAHDMDRRLLERTAEIARSSKGFDAKKIPKTLRIALDSSPLEGAGRVEDTINLIAHAARKVVECVAKIVNSKYEDICRKAGISLLLESSVKKALDRDWSDDEEKAKAIDILARQVLSLERWIHEELPKNIEEAPLEKVLEVLRQLMSQDLEPDPNGGQRIVEGVAEERRISVGDGDMRHGRKSKSKRIDGFKRHVAIDLLSKAVLACAITPANRPEHEAFPELKADIDAQGIILSEVHFDRGYMGSQTVSELAQAGTVILCKPWKAHNGELFSKEVFELDLRAKTIRCPSGEVENIEFGKNVQFSAEACDDCVFRAQCTSAAFGKGRTVSIQQDERLQKRLRILSKTKSGRERFRERIPVEHSLAHIGQRQGHSARYNGTRKNLYDLRRAASIQNLEIVQRMAS